MRVSGAFTTSRQNSTVSKTHEFSVSGYQAVPGLLLAMALVACGTRPANPVDPSRIVVLEVDNAPGELTRIAQTLAQADINIHYAYCTATIRQELGCLVLKTDNPERALQILTR